ncbi:uncharacterized protein C21orf62 homolog [Sorex fumeus]|uniref:uncharacterized protein C21orf62 homolog n=1 Tax=Sorex fumeus TaxID=62283 RepID=UPI0024AD8F5A|nr:uncharacterized protein C21orf62 homolog [Sorex fumeus]
MCVLGTWRPRPRRMAPPAGRSLLLLGALGALGALALPAGAQANSTLILSRENSLRNCSCSADVRDCDYSLANLLCSCHSALPLAAERGSYSGRLTIWFTDAAALGALLNFTRVGDLKLALCGPRGLPTRYLAVCGLRRLRVGAPRPSPEQSLLLAHAAPGTWPAACLSISFLDTALFNRDSALKSFSVENVAGPADGFPRLSLLNTLGPVPGNQSYVITFIY